MPTDHVAHMQDLHYPTEQICSDRMAELLTGKGAPRNMVNSCGNENVVPESN